MKTFALALLCLAMTGCRLFTPPELAVHPDAPMLVLEARGERLRVAVYQADGNRMIERGWIESDDLVGWTVSKYDWEAFIVKRGGETE